MEKSEISIGQRVVVLDGGGRSRATPQYGEVVKIGRVWIDVQREGQRWGWRFRLDTQHDGSTIGHVRFYTEAQWADHLRELAAVNWLREQRIVIDLGSPWQGRAIKLATALGWTYEPPLSGASVEIRL